MTTRANSFGALFGAIVGAGVMFLLWMFTQVNGYFYTTSGIMTCFVTGYLASLLTGKPRQSLAGLTVYTLGGAA